jgi:hypothetical protein
MNVAIHFHSSRNFESIPESAPHPWVVPTAHNGIICINMENKYTIAGIFRLEKKKYIDINSRINIYCFLSAYLMHIMFRETKSS